MKAAHWHESARKRQVIVEEGYDESKPEDLRGAERNRQDIVVRCKGFASVRTLSVDEKPYGGRGGTEMYLTRPNEATFRKNFAMINRYNRQSAVHGECAHSRLHAFPPARVHCSGFTLLELVAVVSILALAGAVMASVFFDKASQTRFERTVESMAALEKAILGVTSDRVRGDVRFAGYVQDMGELPGLFYVTKEGEIVKVNEGETISQILSDCKYPPQPRGLWTKDPEGTPEDENDDLILSKVYWYEMLDFIGVGWRGPYIKPPSSGILVDGWENPVVFQNIDGNLSITSLGSDNKEGGEGFDRDVVHTIKNSSYTGSVSGYVSPQGVFLEECEDQPIAVRIYYRPATSYCEKTTCGTFERYGVTDCVGYMETTAKPDGYFHFNGVPLGRRLLLVRQEATASTPAQGYKLAVEPGDIWLGTLGLVH